MGLTVRRVARLKEPGRYLDSNGLYLQVLSASNRSWLLRYELRARNDGWGVARPRRSRSKKHDSAHARRGNCSPTELTRSTRRTERAKQAAAAGRDKTFAAEGAARPLGSVRIVW